MYSHLIRVLEPVLDLLQSRLSDIFCCSVVLQAETEQLESRPGEEAAGASFLGRPVGKADSSLLSVMWRATP